MNDNMAKYMKMAEKNLGRIVMGVLFLMLGGLIFAWYQEQNAFIGGEGGDGVPAKMTDPIAENTAYKKVQAMAGDQPMSEYPGIQQISQYNMFDYKSVRDKQEIERGAEQKLKQAETAVAAGRTEEAKRLLGEILQQVPSHRKAREMLEKMNPKEKAAATPTPAAANPAAEQPAI